jgi:hypothetical protein
MEVVVFVLGAARVVAIASLLLLAVAAVALSLLCRVHGDTEERYEFACLILADDMMMMGFGIFVLYFPCTIFELDSGFRFGFEL